MYLYALTLQKSGGVLLAVYGMLRRSSCPVPSHLTNADAIFR